MLLGYIDILISNSHRYPKKLALVDGSNRMNWKELHERVNKGSKCITQFENEKEG